MLRFSIIKQQTFPIKRKPIILKIWLKIFVWLGFLNSCQAQFRQTRLWHLLYKDAYFLLAYKAVKDLLSNERGCCQTLSNTTRNMVRSQFSKALSTGSALSTCLSKALFSRYFRCANLWDCYLKMNYRPCWNLRAISSRWTSGQIIEVRGTDCEPGNKRCCRTVVRTPDPYYRKSASVCSHYSSEQSSSYDQLQTEYRDCLHEELQLWSGWECSCTFQQREPAFVVIDFGVKKLDWVQ